MMSWTLCSILSSVNELWEAVDDKHDHYMCNGWEVWLLVFIQSCVFPFEKMRVDKRAPFSKLSSVSNLIDKVNRFSPANANTYEFDNDPRHVFKFSFNFMTNIFNNHSYPTISVVSSVTDALSLDESLFFKQKNIIIVVGSDYPQEVGNVNELANPGKVVFPDGTIFELRSIVLLRSNVYGDNPNTFDAVRYIRPNNN